MASNGLVTNPDKIEFIYYAMTPLLKYADVSSLGKLMNPDY